MFRTFHRKVQIVLQALVFANSASAVSRSPRVFAVASIIFFISSLRKTLIFKAFLHKALNAALQVFVTDPF